MLLKYISKQFVLVLKKVIYNSLYILKAALNKKLMIIKGKSENVAAAKELIENKIKADENKRRELTNSKQGRYTKFRSKNRKGNVIY